MKYTDNKYDILVCSCDAYEDLWEPFFYFLNKHWPELSENRIYLNTESKGYAYADLHIDHVALPKEKKNCTWSERLLFSLNQIQAKYVVLLLDDFFLEETVDTKKIDACIHAMETDKHIVHFGFVPTLWESIDDGIYPDFLRRKRNTPFRVNTQVGLWRKRELAALIRKHESPWDFETYASIRSRFRSGKYYVAKEGKPQAFVYDWFNGGAVHRGKWTARAVELLRDAEIPLDLSLRGLDNQKVIHPDDIPPDPLEESFLGRMYIRAKVLCKHWKSIF